MRSPTKEKRRSGSRRGTSRLPRPVRIVLRVLLVLFVLIVIVANVAYYVFRKTIDYYAGDVIETTGVKQEAVLDKGRELAIHEQREGTVLLRNQDGTLPLPAEVTQVNVFGWASTDWVCAGSGSGGLSCAGQSIYEALKEDNIGYNESLMNMYEKFQNKRPGMDAGALFSDVDQFFQLFEPAIDDRSLYTQDLLDEAKAFSDTALVVLGRENGESLDAPRYQYKRSHAGNDFEYDKSRGYLELSTEEEALLKYVGENYQRVVVLVNSTNVMELGQLETVPGVDACLLCGATGQYGAGAIPQLLWGDMSPSGRTADTFAYAFETAPSYVNSGLAGQGTWANADGMYPADGTTNPNVVPNVPYDGVKYVDYAEGIYVGYRWYETADAEGFWSGVSNEHGQGYDGVVQYPFGYGLSYTSFDWEVSDWSPRRLAGADRDTMVGCEVVVTNTGSCAGTDVVQLYYTPPYERGKTEKPAVSLAAFAKTATIAPGESQTVKLEIALDDMASFDATDADGDGHVGYELDAGDYVLSLRRNAHTIADCDRATMTYTLSEQLSMDTDRITKSEVRPRFTGPNCDDGIASDGSDANCNFTKLSRADFAATMPTGPVEGRQMTDECRGLNLYQEPDAQADDNALSMRLTRAGADVTPPAEADQKARETAATAQTPAATTGSAGDTAADESHGGAQMTPADPADMASDPVALPDNVTLSEKGRLTDHGITLGRNYHSALWDVLLGQLTDDDMKDLVLHGYMGTGRLDSIGKPPLKDLDGPAQVGGFRQLTYGTGFSALSVLSQTWDQLLARDVGYAMGNEAAYLGVDGIYAPSSNIHRSPLGGRNYEYLSEDPHLSGLMSSEVVAGSLNAGTYCFIKHLICNDQDTSRDGLYTFVGEQALREIYLSPFRGMVRAGASGMMTSYNRIGAVWCGGSTALIQGVLRGEWGFHGAVVTDYADHHQYMCADEELRHGGSLFMDGVMGNGAIKFNPDSEAVHLQLRRATKEVLYTWLNARVRNLDYVRDNPAAAARPIKLTGMSPVFTGLIITDAICVLVLIVVLWKRVRRLVHRLGGAIDARGVKRSRGK